MFLLKDHLPTQRTILSDSDVDEMERPQPSTRGQYGLGLWLSERTGQSIISAQGGTTDSYALLEVIPSADAVVVVLSNSFAPFTSELSDKIRGVLVPKLSPPTRQSAPAQTARSEANPPDLVGEWTGNVISYRGSIPLSLTIKSSGPVLGRVGGGPISELGQPSLKGQHLYGQLPGDPHLIDAPRTAYVLEIDAFLRGDTLVGAATSRLLQGEGDQLPHWVELTRAH
jgi:hypothetical protein